VRAVFAYPNPRRAYAAEVARGEAPDSQLLGQNHLVEHGIDARIHDSLLSAAPRPVAGLAWRAREVVVPFELGRADVLLTGQANVLPLVARARRLPTVVVNYGLSQQYRRASTARRRLLRASFRSASRIVCFGATQSDELASLAAVETIPFGVDERWFAPRPEPHGEPRVLTAGKDLARDFSTFAAALAGLDVEADLVALPRNLDGVVLTRNVHARQVSILDLREMYARAACVVVPQRGDGYEYGADGGLTVLLEAMAMGRPVVATSRALVREYVDDGVEALLVPPEDPAALRDAVARVLGDREFASSLGRRARERVERMYTSRGYAAALAPVLRSVV
jgi:glycosyltransferase involved in cell wall biosynthesis